jgi:crotonobetainyl-CoA:carnitine CoA-transferase CaiB-like acyl-CoA transferase
VVVEGFRPGVVRRLGVDYAAVCRVNPSIVYCSITGYGQTGPMRHAAGHDVNYLSRAGLLDLMGEKGRPPAIPGIQVADLVGGGMNGALGILMALFHRQRTGRPAYRHLHDRRHAGPAAHGAVFPGPVRHRTDPRGHLSLPSLRLL